MAMFDGLIAAAVTPMSGNVEWRKGTLELTAIERIVDKLVLDGVQGLYVCGSTGEGVSLSTSERMKVTEAYIQAAAGKLPVFVQVGHNSLEEACWLAEQSSRQRAYAISATCPNYFKIESVSTLIDCMQAVAEAASDLPFYYYHIPGLTGNRVSMTSFLEQAVEKIPNLAGLKFTSPELHVYQSCCQVAPDKLQIFWGTDEMLLPALSVGARAAIGSTYNIAAPLYNELFQAFRDQNFQLARSLQQQANQMIDILKEFPFQSALKYALALRCEISPSQICSSRLPLCSLSSEEEKRLCKCLKAIGFFDW